MASVVDFETFLKAPGIVFDVRSPGEFRQGHIPQAHNLPLFTDLERAQVGTKYKQAGRQCALELGLELVAPKIAELIAAAADQSPDGIAKIHCWRGGMRSTSVALLLESVGFRTATLQGGYKTFRRWALKTLQKPLQLRLLGGMTGSGKTVILQELKSQGQQILDLEDLACHRGSAFGNLGLGMQPSNEQFENEIALQWSNFDPTCPVWIEDESRTIGLCKVPDPIFLAMRNSPLYLIERPLNERILQLKGDYWNLPANDLISSTNRLAKKLGGARTSEIISHINNGSFADATNLLLDYYDMSYRHEMRKRIQEVNIYACEELSPHEWATKLLKVDEK